jgi:hypothetical protein
MFGAWRNHDGNSEVAGAIVQQQQTQVVVDGSQTGLTTPMAPDGSNQSVFGPDYEYATADDLTLPLDGPIIEQENPEVPESYQEPADAAVYADPAEHVDPEARPSTDGPLPEVEGHQWTAQDQTGASVWYQRIATRAMHLGLPEEDAATLANGLMEDYAQTYADGIVAVDRSMTKALRSELRAEYGSDLNVNLDALRGLLKDPTIFGEWGELIASARTPQGHRLINVAPIAKGLIKLATRAGRYIAEEQVDEGSEIDELNALMAENIEEYRRGNWKNSGKTPSDRLYELSKKREAA